MLEVEHLRFSFGAREVLRGVELRVEPGELVFVLGANGAGKTTLFRCILGLLPGYQGRIRVDGGDVSSLTPRALAQKVAYIPQTSHMVFPYTALELVLMGTNHRLGLFSAPGRRERAIALEALAELGLSLIHISRSWRSASRAASAGDRPRSRISRSTRCSMPQWIKILFSPGWPDRTWSAHRPTTTQEPRPASERTAPSSASASPQGISSRAASRRPISKPPLP